jgi:hypothetical protein
MSTADETKENDVSDAGADLPTKGWRRAARAYWWATLALSVFVSAYGNIRHAEAVAPAHYLGEARVFAGSLPVVLLLMVEGIAIGVRGGIAGWRRTMATVFVAVLAVVVLASSYIGLLSVVESMGLFQADVLNYGLAGVPDLLMIAATVYVMALREPESGAESAEKAPGRISRMTGLALDRVETKLAAPADEQTTDDRSADGTDELTVPGDDRTAPRIVSGPVNGVVNDPVSPSTATDGAQVSAGAAPATDEMTMTGAVPADSAAVSDGPVSAGQLTMRTGDGAAGLTVRTDELTVVTDDAADGAVDDRAAELADLARQVRQSKGARAAADRIARGLALSESGLSPTAIAKELGGSHNTVRGWVEEAARIDPRFGRPGLELVGGQSAGN